ncbi:MAG TPA: transporter [Burkholderiales bacterium]|nr:transporter [Burkholderiales bacterium]
MLAKTAVICSGVASALIAMQAQASCGSAFCMVDTNWSMQGVTTAPGTRLDLRYEYINQDRAQNGRHRIAVGEILRDHDEVQTVNRNWVGTLDHNFDGTWAITATLPVVHRTHFHIQNNDDGTQTPESWKFTEAGDLRLLGRYQFAPQESAEHTLGQAGLYFGLKLPTGSFKVKNAEGELAERTLQPGTGTTDAMLGAFWRQALPLKDFSWFAQGLIQVPLNAREDYRPGQRINLDAGVRYEAGEKVALLVQANALIRGRDSGAQAEPEDSGGRSLWLSPGVSYAVTKSMQAYAFFQLPLYQFVNGAQLVAERSLVIGVSTRF